MLKLLSYFVLLFTSLQSFGQTPRYELKKEREIALVGIGLGTIITASVLERQTDPLSAIQLEGVGNEILSPIDRWATTQNSIKAKNASEVVMYGATALPLVSSFLFVKNEEKFKIGLMAFEVLSITYGVRGLAKVMFPRNRPFVYNNEVDEAPKLEVDARESFFSGHTAYVSAACFFSASMASTYSNNSLVKALAWGSAAALPAVTGYLRMKAGKHFLTDVVTGYVVGGAIGYFIPKLHENKKGTTTLSIVPSFGRTYSGLLVVVKL